MSARHRILFTGGTGFIGRNVISFLRERFEVVSPTRVELNLLDDEAVSRFVREGSFDVVVHSANTTPAKNPLDKVDRMLPDTLRAYYNLRRNADAFGRLLFVGSGAEYDKRFPICSVTEEAIGIHVPADDYGFAKFLLNEDARRSDNVINLRIFGCYGPWDWKTKFIRDAIDCCIEGRAITIRQDCIFDYMYVGDLGPVFARFIEGAPRFHDYNVCTGQRVPLSDIARIVARQMGNNRPLNITKPGWNREYTASNARLLSEFPDLEYTSLEDGIARQIAWQKEFA